MANQYALRGEIPGAHHLRAALNDSGGTLAEGRFVVGNEKSIDYPAAQTDVVYGLLRMTTLDGRMGNVQTLGKGIAQVGAAGATENTRLTIEAATGKVVNWAPGAGVNRTIVGIALETGAADEKIEIEILPPGVIGQGA
jgi:hypothetical protein